MIPALFILLNASVISSFLYLSLLCSKISSYAQGMSLLLAASKEYKYDARGRRIEEKDVLSDAESYLTQFEYDPSGNLISKTDKEGRTTAYEAFFILW